MTQTLFLGEEIGRASLYFIHHNSNTWKFHVKFLVQPFVIIDITKACLWIIHALYFSKWNEKEVSYDLISILCNHKYFRLPHYLWYPENVYTSYTDKLEFRFSSTMREADIFLYFVIFTKKSNDLQRNWSSSLKLRKKDYVTSLIM